MARFLSLVIPALAVSAAASVLDRRADGGYIQEASGLASFTTYSGCSSPGLLHLYSFTCVINIHQPVAKL